MISVLENQVQGLLQLYLWMWKWYERGLPPPFKHFSTIVAPVAPAPSINWLETMVRPVLIKSDRLMVESARNWFGKAPSSPPNGPRDSIGWPVTDWKALADSSDSVAEVQTNVLTASAVPPLRDCTALSGPSKEIYPMVLGHCATKDPKWYQSNLTGPSVLQPDLRHTHTG